MEFKDIFSLANKEINERLNGSSKNYKKSFAYDSDAIFKSSSLSGSMESLAANESFGLSLIETNEITSTIRKAFNKPAEPKRTIGCHPDFEHLKNTSVLENGYSVTLFLDIAGSTKLGKLYPSEIVFNIKNTIIKYAIEIIQSFDGHVHRIMGDAVMAFFRSNEKDRSGKIIDSGIDAINCAVYIIEFVEQVITPYFGGIKIADPIGVRIGIDYGKNDDIIWGNYGAFGAFEVTATSYYVDVAAKLQQRAKTNKIMIGSNLKKLLGFGAEYTGYLTRKKTKDGKPYDKEYKYVEPNYSIRGNQINYYQYELDNKSYFSFLPYGQKNSDLSVSLKAIDKNGREFYYYPCSLALDRNLDLEFKVQFFSHAQSGIQIKSRKVNTGIDAKNNSATKEKIRVHNAEYYNGSFNGTVSESTRYHGLHHMYISILKDSKPITNELCFSIFIS